MHRCRSKTLNDLRNAQKEIKYSTKDTLILLSFIYSKSSLDDPTNVFEVNPSDQSGGDLEPD